MSHTNDKLCFCADGYVIHEGKLLLHFHPKYSMWVTPGGHVDPGENPFEAAKPEVLEETGLLVEPLNEYVPHTSSKDLPLPLFINEHAVGNGRVHTTFGYVFKALSTTLHPRPEEGELEFCWLSADDLRSTALELSEHVRVHGIEAIALAAQKPIHK